MKAQNNQIKAKISFSFTEIQTSLKGSLQISLDIKCSKNSLTQMIAFTKIKTKNFR